MSEDDFDNFANKVKELAMEVRAGICPIWQCGGELEFLEDRTNWQEPDLKCKNCGATWLLQSKEKPHNPEKFFKELESMEQQSMKDVEEYTKVINDEKEKNSIPRRSANNTKNEILTKE